MKLFLLHNFEPEPIGFDPVWLIVLLLLIGGNAVFWSAIVVWVAS